MVTCHGYTPWLHAMVTCHGYTPWLHVMVTCHGYMPWLHGYMPWLHGYMPWLHGYMPWLHGYMPWLSIETLQAISNPVSQALPYANEKSDQAGWRPTGLSFYHQPPPLPFFLLRSGHVTIEAKGFDVYIVVCGSGCTPPAVRIGLGNAY